MDNLNSSLLKFIKINKPIYVYGRSGTGKTTMLKNIPNAHYFSLNEINSFDEVLSYTNPSIVQVMTKNITKTIFKFFLSKFKFFISYISDFKFVF